MSKNAVLQRVEVNEGETLNSAMDRLGLVLEDSHYYEHMVRCTLNNRGAK
jgi:hypothetical protein